MEPTAVSMVTDEVRAPDVGFVESARSYHVMHETVILLRRVHRSRKYEAKLVALMYVVQGEVGRSHGQT
jgi:hypothetical protein